MIILLTILNTQKIFGRCDGKGGLKQLNEITKKNFKNNNKMNDKVIILGASVG